MHHDVILTLHPTPNLTLTPTLTTALTPTPTLTLTLGLGELGLSEMGLGEMRRHPTDKDSIPGYHFLNPESRDWRCFNPGILGL